MPKDNSLITAASLRERLGGVSDMSLWRWERDRKMAFPKPIRINGRRYWRIAEIDAWVTKRAARAA